MEDNSLGKEGADQKKGSFDFSKQQINSFSNVSQGESSPKRKQSHVRLSKDLGVSV
jgi:hypothetical protein